MGLNSEYESFLLSRNHYDTQVSMLSPAGDLLDASVRRHLSVKGAKATAGRLYQLADLVAVRGIEEPVPVATAKVNPELPLVDRVFGNGARHVLVMIGFAFGWLVSSVFQVWMSI